MHGFGRPGPRFVARLTRHSRMNSDKSAKTSFVTALAPRNLLEAAAANGFKTFGKAVELAGLGATLTGPGPFTVLAPTDAAFNRLPAGKLDLLFTPANRPELVSLLNFHLIHGKKSAADLGKAESTGTLNGALAAVKLDGSQLCVDGAKVMMPDLAARNGVLHGIDKVNLPPAPGSPQ
jgi:uncharacterized surface protein with fasciclin (FAS1) repeats